jgi:hypothetical protein
MKLNDYLTASGGGRGAQGGDVLVTNGTHESFSRDVITH